MIYVDKIDIIDIRKLQRLQFWCKFTNSVIFRLLPSMVAFQGSRALFEN